MRQVVAYPRSRPQYAEVSEAGQFAMRLSSSSAAYSRSDPDSRLDAKALVCRWVIRLPTFSPDCFDEVSSTLGFCSPLALLLTGKPFQALANFILYVLSFVFWITIIFHHIGFLLWGIGVLHAVLAINHAREERRARRIIEATRPQ